MRLTSYELPFINQTYAAYELHKISPLLKKVGFVLFYNSIHKFDAERLGRHSKIEFWNNKCWANKRTFAHPTGLPSLEPLINGQLNYFFLNYYNKMYLPD